MRSYELRDPARNAFLLLASDARRAVGAVIAELLDERLPLVGPKDVSVTRGAQLMGRSVPGTDLVVCYVPAGDHVFIVDVARRPAR